MTKDFEELHFILFILNKPFNTNNALNRAKTGKTKGQEILKIN